MKYFYLIAACLLFFINTAFAQKDSTIYYVKKPGKIVKSIDSADYSIMILPPDKKIGKLYRIKEYYANGKLKLMGNSSTDNMPFIYQGTVIMYFPGGRKSFMGGFTNGEPFGQMIRYYPNGAFYSRKQVYNMPTGRKGVEYLDCSDSTGKVLTADGNGYWKEYDDDFTKLVQQGKIVNGVQDSVWTMSTEQGVPYTMTFKDGKIIENNDPGNDKIFKSVETYPEFPGGLDAFVKFLSRNVNYPVRARDKGVQGRVVISFVVEKDGTLTDIKMISGIGSGCDEEALRVMKMSPPWTPGTQGGKPVRTSYSVPISFTLSN